MTWADLARDLAVELAKAPSKDLAELKARSLYQIARTHGIPNPPDDTQLNLGVAALRRFLADAPAHPKAVRASFEIGASYLNRGKAESAPSRRSAPSSRGTLYKAESDEAKRDLADLSMTATFQVAQTLQGQGEVRRGDRRLSGLPGQVPQRPAVGRRPAGDPRHQAPDRRRRPALARSTPRPGPPGRPSSPRTRSTAGCPQLLFEVGQSFETEKKFDEAIAAWDPLIGKFPGSEPAAHAQFEVASIFEIEKGDPAGAIERFRKVAAEPWKSQAAQRVAVMESKALTVVTPRAFRSGETAHLKITTEEPREPHLHRLQAERRGLFPQEARPGRRRVARRRPGRARRRVDRAGPGLRASSSRSSRPMTSRSPCRASTS